MWNGLSARGFLFITFIVFANVLVDLWSNLPHSHGIDANQRRGLAQEEATVEIEVSADGVPMTAEYASAIPKRIYIVHRFDFCNVSSPSFLQYALYKDDPFYFQLVLNVQKIKAFHPDFRVICFDDESALDYILNVRNDAVFAAYFQNERNGAYKSDLFRVYLLFFEGGYYFDSDMEPRMSVSRVSSSNKGPTTFISAFALDGESIFQSILGATVANPILKKNLEIIHRHYAQMKNQEKPETPHNMGTVFLYQALRETIEASNGAAWQSSHHRATGELQTRDGQVVRLFGEMRYAGPGADRILSQRKAGKTWDYIFGIAVYDPVTGEYPFWSRFTGYGNQWFRKHD